jgi:hypothetical protein
MILPITGKMPLFLALGHLRFWAKNHLLKEILN